MSSVFGSLSGGCTPLSLYLVWVLRQGTMLHLGKPIFGELFLGVRNTKIGNKKKVYGLDFFKFAEL